MAFWLGLLSVAQKIKEEEAAGYHSYFIGGGSRKKEKKRKNTHTPSWIYLQSKCMSHAWSVKEPYILTRISPSHKQWPIKSLLLLLLLRIDAVYIAFILTSDNYLNLEWQKGCLFSGHIVRS